MTEEEAASEAVDGEKEDGEGDEDEEEEPKGDNSAAKTPVSLLQVCSMPPASLASLPPAPCFPTSLPHKCCPGAVCEEGGDT